MFARIHTCMQGNKAQIMVDVTPSRKVVTMPHEEYIELLKAVELALKYVNKDRLPLVAKMSQMSGAGLEIYEQSPVFKDLTAKKLKIEALLMQLEG